MGQITLIISLCWRPCRRWRWGRSCAPVQLSCTFPPRTPGSGGEDLAGGETNLTIGNAPQSRREGPPPTTAAAVAAAAPFSCRAGCRPWQQHKGKEEAQHQLCCHCCLPTSGGGEAWQELTLLPPTKKVKGEGWCSHCLWPFLTATPDTALPVTPNNNIKREEAQRQE